MSEESRDKLLRALAELEPEDAVAPGGGNDRPAAPGTDDAGPDEAVLQAYRDGTLEAARREAIEARLATDPRARARLLETVGLRAAQPAPWVREAVLGAVAPRRSPSAWRRSPWRLVAAAASVVVALGYCFLPTRDLPADVTFSVQASGLASERGTVPAAGVVEAWPQTPIAIDVTPLGRPRDGLEFGLYARRDDAWVRLTERDGVSTEAVRGAARIRVARAGAVAATPGRHVLLAVVARGDDLPERVSADDAGAAAGRLAAGDRRRVSTIEIVLRASREDLDGEREETTSLEDR